MDLGRPPLARFPSGDAVLREAPMSREELEAVLSQVTAFGGDRRAGIDRTLHRISAIINRDGDVVGLTCRVGRTIPGSADMAIDLAAEGRSLLMLGRPGVGKTTAIRELSRMLADDLGKRVVIVDTSNEIGGDGDVPHPGIGAARRMQVPHPELQHNIMIEAVENHMPEVIVIDEIGTEAECLAARTIAQRGVQLIATAHGQELANVIQNPSLQDLLGGVQNVTLGDDEARRRGAQKTVRERGSAPTFTACIEMLELQRWRVHSDVAPAVDRLLQGKDPAAEVRFRDASGKVCSVPDIPADTASDAATKASSTAQPLDRLKALNRRQHRAAELRASPKPRAMFCRNLCNHFPTLLQVYSYGLDVQQVQRTIKKLRQRDSVELISHLPDSDAVLALRSKVKSGGWLRLAAKHAGVPVFSVKRGDQLENALRTLLGIYPAPGGAQTSSAAAGDDGARQYGGVTSQREAESHSEALEEARIAVESIVLPRQQPIELMPRAEDVVEAQDLFVRETYLLDCELVGRDLNKRLRILPTQLAAELAGSLESLEFIEQTGAP
eukprot:jgi/Astpho2/1828/e_gw1.00038.58.1_t